MKLSQFKFKLPEEQIALNPPYHRDECRLMVIHRVSQKIEMYRKDENGEPLKDEEGNPLVDLYGADDFLLNTMDVIEGEIDWEALKTGEYALYALTMDDNGNIIDNPSIHVGDTITFHHWTMDGLAGTLDNSFELTVMAKVATSNAS